MHQTGYQVSWPSRLPLRPVLILGALLLTLVAVAAPVVVREPGRITVFNAHFTASFEAAAGGGLSRLAGEKGELICSGHALYTDWGIYEGRTYYGTAHCPATLTVTELAEEVVVRAEGQLCDIHGVTPTNPGTISYWFRYRLSEAPKIQVEWGATPDFEKPGLDAFYAYILGVTGCVGVFANTRAGVLLQDPADHSTRTYQSANEPLHPADPWLGVMRPDGSILSFSGLEAKPPFANVFLHEDGHGGAGVFFAWACGGTAPGLKAGEEWRGAFTISLHRSLEEFLGSRLMELVYEP